MDFLLIFNLCQTYSNICKKSSLEGSMMAIHHWRNRELGQEFTKFSAFQYYFKEAVHEPCMKFRTKWWRFQNTPLSTFISMENHPKRQILDFLKGGGGGGGSNGNFCTPTFRSAKNPPQKPIVENPQWKQLQQDYTWHTAIWSVFYPFDGIPSGDVFIFMV